MADITLNENYLTSTERVPFYVPEARESATVSIGGKDLDNVSELSEDISDESTDTEIVSVKREDETIQNYLNDASTSEEEISTDSYNENSGLRILSIPQDADFQVGMAINLSCTVQGMKPIGQN